MDQVEPLLSNVTFDHDILTKVYLGGYPNLVPGGTTPGGRFADFNVWGRALDKKEMEEWTSCRC